MTTLTLSSHFKLVTEWPGEAIYSVHREEVYRRALAFVDTVIEGQLAGMEAEPVLLERAA